MKLHEIEMLALLLERAQEKFTKAEIHWINTFLRMERAQLIGELAQDKAPENEVQE